MFPLNPTIILQGVPNDLTRFLNMPLQSIKHWIVPLALDDPWIPLLKKNQMGLNRFNALHKGWWKKHCIMEKESCGPKVPWVPSFGKELPHDISGIPPPLLSKRPTKEPMFHQFHRLWAAMGATFVNTREIFQCHSLTTTALWMTDQRRQPLFVP